MYKGNATFTAHQLAERWQVHTETVRRMMRNGDLQFFRIGQQKRIPESEVLRVERLRSPQTSS